MDIVFYLILLAGGLAGANFAEPDYVYAPPAVIEEPGTDPSGSAPPDPGVALPIAPEPPDGVAVAPQPPQPDPPQPQPPQDDVVVAPEPPGVEPPAPPQPPVDAPTYAAETDPPTGKMTTAAEIRPILSVTKPQWVAVRDFDGQDLLYFTNLLAWRCGLHEIRYSVNGGPLELLEMEPCYLDEATPNGIKTDAPYVELPAGSVSTVRVEVLYDDLGTDTADYSRADIQMN